jgi:GATA-binding protein
VENCSGIDIDSPENSMGNNEAAKMLDMSGLANEIRMTQRPMGIQAIGTQPMGGITGQNGVGGAVTGPQEWEWLTMSL